MLDINLTGERGGMRRERSFDVSEFKVDLTTEQIHGLREMESRELQDRLNEIFSVERRGAMLAKASKDPSGRPVRYYRKMSKKRFFAMLERGYDASIPNDEIEHDELVYRIANMLGRYADYLNIKGELGDELNEKINDLAHSRDINGLISYLIPAMPWVDRKILTEGSSLEEVRSVLARYLPNELKQRIHGGSADFILTDYISMSAGGVISDISYWEVVYLEIVMDDSEIIIPGYCCEGEKEVLTKSVGVGNVSRAIVSGEQMSREFVQANDSNIRIAIEQSGKKIDRAIETWRWGTRRDDYLPIGLQDKAKHSQTYGFDPHFLEISDKK